MSPLRRFSDDVVSNAVTGSTAFFVVVVVGTLGLLGLAFHDARVRSSDAITAAGGRLTAQFSHELTLRSTAVDSMALAAEDMLSRGVSPSYGIAASLRPVPDKGGYTLFVPDGYEAGDIGNLTGEGAAPTAAEPGAAEMDVAFALTPYFRSLVDHSPDTAWVYYVSRRGFNYLYPRVPVSEYFWDRGLLAAHFTPKGKALAPVHRLYWSSPYLDLVGKGLMTTVSCPVVVRSEVVATVSADLRMASLMQTIDVDDVRESSVHLLSDAGVDMLDASSLPIRLDPARMAAGRPAQIDAYEVVVFPVTVTGWYLAVVTPHAALWVLAARQCAIYVFLLLLVVGSAGVGYVLLRLLRRLSELTIRDALTGAFNRRHFDDALRVEVSRARRGSAAMGLALIDVDHFKAFNDRYGHQAGDDALRLVVAALQGTLCRAGDMLFRVGGEEFAVLVVVERAEQVEMLSERLRAAVDAVARAHEGSPSGRLTISVGATFVGAQRWVDATTAYKRADAALYRAKSMGRNRVELVVDET